METLILTLGALASQAIARTLQDDTYEKEKRFKIFKENVAYIESFNGVANKPYKLGINQFADLTNEEFVATRNRFMGHECLAQSSSFKYKNVTVLSSVMDWRKKGEVTPITDQGQCELVDCDIKGIDQGCGGGLMDNAFQFIQHNQGLTTKANYPYKGVDETCNTKEESNHAAKINGYDDVPANSKKALLKAVANQPVSVAIDAGGSDFQFYSSGIFIGACGTSLGHGVTAIGYRITNDGTKYWLVKNSWGTKWAEAGYIRMQRDVDGEEGLCGIALQASYPTA
ncbi:hypothetical protein I3843_14G096400 [Carya illinoinensis]|nr:hypothetical protein I3843_14G096400 [Carya illinoinensis]